MTPVEQQRLRALAQANETRAARSHWKRAVREMDRATSMRALAVLVGDPPEWASTWRLTDILHALPRFGRVKIRRTMTGWAFGEQLRLGAMTERQRRLVVEWALERVEARAA